MKHICCNTVKYWWNNCHTTYNHGSRYFCYIHSVVKILTNLHECSSAAAKKYRIHVMLHRWQKGKMLLLASLSAWIIFTLPLGLIQPPATSCILKENHTYVLKTLAPPERVYKREVDRSTLSLTVDSDLQKPGAGSTDTNTFLSRNIRSYNQGKTTGQSPLDVRFASNYK
jgi:hypothetical protein